MGSYNLAQYVYGANNGKLASTIFGNGDSEQYEYDALNNLSSLCYNNSSTPAFTWTYDLSGLLKSRYDAVSRITETYEYDSYSRLSSSTLKQTVDVYDEYEYEPSGTSLVTRLTTTYSYDNYGRTSSVGYAFANKSYTRSVTYGLSDRINSYTVSGALSKVNSYDALNRLSGVSLKNASNSEVIGTSYDYNGMLPSSEISSFTEFYYTYDAANRITRIAEYGDDVACYAYDAQGQLIREDNAAANKTWIYTYDNYGNILTRSTYDFSTDDLEYLGSPSSVKTWNYTSSPIGKQLYQSSYDALGNPTYDHERSWSYTWDGRRLTEIMVDGVSPIFQAKYNEDGIRTHKAYSEDGSEFTYHDYILEGSLILQEHAYSFYSPDPWEDPVTYYTNYYYYDENGSLVGLNYNGTNYYYYKNILGDILGIVNSSGEFVVEYAYDAWGNIISTTGSMASTLGQANPFRYRGYYYDAETGFYYLNSRYYDPSACRFINADALFSYDSALSANLYAYCCNSPVNAVDHSGHDAIWLQDSDGVPFFGHSGLLLQDGDGQWWHFYWGPINPFPALSKNKNVSIKYNGKIDRDSINSFYAANHDGASYESMLYFAGDFSGNFPNIKNLNLNSYHLIANNCVQKSVEAFLLGKLRYNDDLYRGRLTDTLHLIPNYTYDVIYRLYESFRFNRSFPRSMRSLKGEYYSNMWYER